MMRLCEGPPVKKIVLPVLLCLLVGLYACAKKAPPELERGMAVMRYMTSPVFLSQSRFYVLYPEGKPSDYIKYIFSSFGTSEWPPLEGGVEDNEMTREAMKATRTPMIPANVLFVPLKPNRSKRQPQVVLKSNNDAGVLILEGYADPTEPPVMTEERTLSPLGGMPGRR